MHRSRQSRTNVTCIIIISNSSLYQGTVRFNILLGSTELNPTQEEIDEACKGANVRVLFNVAN
jgi:ABC-type multidrug transport system fused ATPase/permease subunit